MADARFKQEFLDAHNSYRERHSSPALMYSKELCRAAQKRAEHLLSNPASEHNYGENVYSCKSAPQGQAVVDSWYEKSKDFAKCKSTTELGVGLATDGNTEFIVVGQY